VKEARIDCMLYDSSYRNSKKKQIMTNSKSVVAKGLKMREKLKGLFGVLGKNIS